MKQRIPLLLLLLLSTWGVRAQTLLQQQSFEGTGTDALAANGYTSTTVATGNTNIYFYNATLPVPGYNTGAGQVSTVTNIEGIAANSTGTHFWASENVRRSFPANVPRGNPAADLTLNSISVAGKSSLFVKVALADASGAPNNTLARWETDDYVRVQYRFNGTGVWNTIGQFVSDGSIGGGPPPSGRLAQDTDLDGVFNAGAPVLNQALTDYTFNIPGSGSTLEVRVEIDQDGASEEFGFDNIRVYGSAAASAAPVLANIETTALMYAEGNPATAITSTLTVSDADNTTLSGGTVKISGNYDSSEDRLLFTSQNGITGNFNTTTGTLTLSGTATLAAYQAALRSVQYQNIDAADASGLTRTVSFAVTDASSVISTDVTRNIAVTNALDAASTLPYTEPFETDGEGTRYASNHFYNQDEIQFQRATTNPVPGASPTTFGNVAGSGYWFGVNTTSTANPAAVDNGVVTTKQVNAAGFTNLHFQIRLGASVPNGLNNGTGASWLNAYSFQLFYRPSGSSTWTAFGLFRGTGAAYSDYGVIRQDANPNGTGTPTGTQLTTTLQNFDFTLPTALNGQTVDFQVILLNGDSSNDFAFDQIQVTGTAAAAPTVTTTAPASVTINSAVLGGNVTADGGATVTERGVVYVVGTGTPTTANTKALVATSGIVIGTAFSGTVSGLAPGTQYTVRAYAINSVGTAYGSNQTFTTSTITLAPTTLPAGTVAAAYSQTITASGGTSPYTYAITAGALPAGLSLSSAGVLSGTPTAGGSFSFTVTATDASTGGGPYTGARAYTLTIAAPTIVVSPATLPGGTVAAAYSQTITASGGTAPYSFAITSGALPAGLTLSSAGVLSGTPTAGGSFTFTVTATDASTGSGPYTGARAYTLTVAAPTIAVAPATLPNGATGTAYSQTITASGGTAPYSFAVTTGALPTGLSLSAAGVLSGTPTAANSFTFTVTATDASTGSGPYTGSRSYTVTIVNSATTVSSVTRLNPSPTATAQVSYRVVFAASVTGVTVSNFTTTNVGTTVTGSSISSVSGSGTTYTVVVNTGTGSGTLRLDVANSTGISPTVSNVPYTSGEVYTITKDFAAAPQLTIRGTGGTGSDVTAFVDVVQVLSGGSAFANGLQNGSFETHGALANGDFGYNPSGATWTFNAQSGIAEAGSAFTPTTPIPNGIAVAFVQSNGGGNGQLQQNLAVPTGSSYQVRFQASQRVCCTTLDQALNVFLNGVFLGTIQPNNSGYSTFTSATFAVTAPALTATVSTTSGSPTSTTPIPFSVSFTAGGVAQSVGTTFTASDVTVTGGTLNTASFSGSGAGPYTFTVTPSVLGSVSVSVVAGVATDANNTANTASNAVSVTYQGPTITVAPATLPGGTVATAYSQTITASGGTSPYSYAIMAGALPAGLSLSSGGVLSGTPTAGGSFTFTVTATDASTTPGPYTGSRAYTLTVAAPTIAVAPATLPGGTAAAAYSQTITASGGTAPYSFAITAGALPAGLSLSSAGVLSGTPTAGGSFTFTVTATDASTGAGPYAGSRAYTLTVAAPTITVAPATLPGGTAGTAYSQTLTASGGTAPRSFAVTAGALPAGLTLSSGGVLSGTPTASGSFTFTVTATDASTGSGPYSGSRSYTLAIGQTSTAAPTLSVSGNIVNGEPTFTGTAPAGSTVTITVTRTSPATPAYSQTLTATATGGGTFTYTVAQGQAVPIGVYSATATAQTSGNAASGNSNTVSFTVPTTGPTTVITSTAPNPATLSPIPVTVTFSRNVDGFDATDVQVTNGVVGNFLGGGTTFTFDVTPAANGLVTVNVPAGAAQDSLNRPNQAAPQFSRNFQQQVTATPVLTTPANGLVTNNNTVTIAGTAVSGSMVEVYINGVQGSSALVADGSGNFSLGPIPGTPDGTYAVYVTAQATGQAVSANSNTNTFTIDTAAPTVTISSTASNPTSTSPIPVTVTFSEVVTGFVQGDVSVSSGSTISGFSGSGTTYTFNVTPTANGVVTVNVAANVAQDAAANGNTAAPQFSITYNGIAATAVGWNGSVSTDWYTAANWTPATVPTATIDATIPASAPRMPLIAAGTATAKNVTINSGASLSMSAGTLDIRGNLTNNGTFVPTGGTVVLGSVAQTNGPNILGSSRVRFWNLRVESNGVNVSTSAGASARRLVTLNGALVTNGNPFVLESDATNTGMIVNNNGNAGIIFGLATVQRYIAPDLNPNLGYRHMSAPVGSLTVADLATGSYSPVVNPAYNSSATPSLTTPYPTVYGYDQSRLATATNNLGLFDKGWFSPNATTDPLTVGRGYTVLIRANQTWNFTGPQTSGNVSLSLARNSGPTPTIASNSGLQLIGNPYASPLDWSLVTAADRPNMDGAIYVWNSTSPSNPYTGAYGTYNNGVGNISPVLPLGQGFFARVTPGQTSGTVNFKNSHRVTSYTNPTYRRGTAETRPLVQLTLQGSGSSLTDDVFVYFEQGATAANDGAFDALKVSNPNGLNVAAVTGAEEFAINGLPVLGTAQLTVPLTVQVPATGTYTFRTAQLLNLTSTPTYLRDRQTGALVDLHVQPDYTFTLNAAFTGPRFELVFAPQGALATAPASLSAQVAVFPNPASKVAFVELPVGLTRTAATAALVDALGRTVRTFALPAGLGTHQLPLVDVATGVYSLRIGTAQGTVTKKLVVE